MQKDIRREGNPSGFYREDGIHQKLFIRNFFGITLRKPHNQKRAGRNSRPAGGVAAMPSEATNPASDGICLPKSK